MLLVLEPDMPGDEAFGTGLVLWFWSESSREPLLSYGQTHRKNRRNINMLDAFLGLY
jgi:hypothetical protein